MTECTFANWIEIDGANDVNRIDVDVGTPGRQVGVRAIDFGQDGDFDRASATLPLDRLANLVGGYEPETAEQDPIEDVVDCAEDITDTFVEETLPALIEEIRRGIRDGRIGLVPQQQYSGLFSPAWVSRANICDVGSEFQTATHYEGDLNDDYPTISIDMTDYNDDGRVDGLLIRAVIKGTDTSRAGLTILVRDRFSSADRGREYCLRNGRENPDVAAFLRPFDSFLPSPHDLAVARAMAW